MELLRTPKDMRKFILPNIVIYIIHVIFFIQENSRKLFILYVCWETNQKKNVISLSFSVVFWFYDEIPVVRYVCFLASVDNITRTSVTGTTLNFINCDGR